MVTARFRLSGGLNDIKWIGDAMELASSLPIRCVVSIEEDWKADEKGENTRAAKVASVCIHEVSDQIVEVSKAAGEGEIFFGAFPVEPVNAQQELRDIREKVARATVDVLNTLRWSLGLLGPPNPIVNPRFEISVDGETWNSIGPVPLFRRRFNPPLSHSMQWQKSLQAQIDSGTKEPISRTLLREAYASISANPRATLVLGVASIEIGTKDCIAKLVPEASWVLDNAPSPPTHAILSKYLPDLLSRRGNLSHYVPTDRQLRAIQSAVENRNTIVHKFASAERLARVDAALAYLEMEKFLWLCRDMLDQFDLYSGITKAINRLSSTTKNEMIERYGGRALPDPNT